MSTDVNAADPSTAPRDADRTASPPETGRFERVLAVTTGGAGDDAAVSTAVDLAAAHGAAVDALYVVDTTEHWDLLVERRERDGERIVEAAEAAGAAAGVPVEKWFRYGTPHREAIDFAAAHDADLVVVGSAGRTGLDRLIHPEPVPTRVRRGVDVPVVIVGPDDD
ncbi:UspA domain-containing protein [Halorubrum californiense DSM 19288]|uniref:UspA domain-containing protein n=1 Tax=Halorubrum californiense DSM 19288 TaxID=1227465 RepID=M0E5C6_9EURY|nr:MULTISPECIES: universal stress protein [Halorubrum]ELZ42981.1 UspA domain-containing protein [Halorubrum californiense DSM 19288]TKX68788.1 universal stress protein [Halorubrum sp. GN11GM_10-3_MGM]